MSQSSDGNSEALKDKQDRIYRKDLSVMSDVGDNKTIRADSIISEACKLVGSDKVLGCAPRSGNLHELTLADKWSVDIIEDGIMVNGKMYEARKSVQDTFVMSVMYLPTYVTDDEIENRLCHLQVKILSQIKRRYIDIDGKKFADGTRFCKVRLPDARKSLPLT